MLLLPTLLLGWILCGIEMDILAPCLPALQGVFGLSHTSVEWIMIISSVGHLIGAIIIGVASDRFGYRPVIIFEAFIFFLGSLICCYSQDFYFLLFGRFLQGFGIASTTTLLYLVLTNIYSIQKLQEIVGFCNGVISIAGSLAPVIGSYLAFLLGWRANLTLLLALGFLSLIGVMLFVPKHTPQGNASLSLREYGKIINSRPTLYYIISIGSVVMAYFVFVAIAPLLYMQVYKVELKHYGLYQGFLALTYCIASFSNGYFIRKYGTKKCIIFGVICLSIFVILSFGAAIINLNNPLLITCIMFFLSVGIVIPSNILYPLMFEILPNSKGKTSAILTLVKMVVLGGGIQIAIYFYNESFVSLGITLGSIVVISLYYTYKVLIIEGEVSKLY